MDGVYAYYLAKAVNSFFLIYILLEMRGICLFLQSLSIYVFTHPRFYTQTTILFTCLHQIYESI